MRTGERCEHLALLECVRHQRDGRLAVGIAPKLLLQYHEKNLSRALREGQPRRRKPFLFGQSTARKRTHVTGRKRSAKGLAPLRTSRARSRQSLAAAPVRHKSRSRPAHLLPRTLLPRTLLFNHHGSRGELRARSPILDVTVNRTISLHPGWRVVWYDDVMCLDLVAALSKEGRVGTHAAPWYHRKAAPARSQAGSVNDATWGKYKSDLCRLAQLYRYGGVYVDNDLMLLRGLEPLRHHRFSTALAARRSGGVEPLMQGVLASGAGEPIIGVALRTFSRWIDGDVRILSGWAGPNLLSRSLREYLQEELECVCSSKGSRTAGSYCNRRIQS